MQREGEGDNLPDRKLRTRILSVIVLTMLAVPIALLTSLWAPYSTYESGFPFSWETRGCVAILNLLGEFGCTPISYNWWTFLVDVLFYTAVGCGLLFAYANYQKENEGSFYRINRSRARCLSMRYFRA